MLQRHGGIFISLPKSQSRTLFYPLGITVLFPTTKFASGSYPCSNHSRPITRSLTTSINPHVIFSIWTSTSHHPGKVINTLGYPNTLSSNERRQRVRVAHVSKMGLPTDISAANHPNHRPFPASRHSNPHYLEWTPAHEKRLQHVQTQLAKAQAEWSEEQEIWLDEVGTSLLLAVDEPRSRQQGLGICGQAWLQVWFC